MPPTVPASTLTERLEAVRARIAIACAAAGRSPQAVRLIAVSKKHGSVAIREAYAAGQRDFGESYAQELADKARELADLPELRWHFIGHLQRNKVKLVLEHASVVHAVDSPRLAEALSTRAQERGRPVEVLLEVNVSGEASKHGVASAELASLVRHARDLPGLRLRGLMTLPPPSVDAARAAFDSLVSLRDALGGVDALPELSMGMSDDLEQAIAAGSTLVRIGTAIFGER